MTSDNTEYDTAVRELTDRIFRRTKPDPPKPPLLEPKQRLHVPLEGRVDNSPPTHAEQAAEFVADLFGHPR